MTDHQKVAGQSSAEELPVTEKQRTEFETGILDAVRHFDWASLASDTGSNSLEPMVNAARAVAAGSVSAMRRVFPAEGQLGCGKGCSYCCHLMATASAPEVLVISRFLHRTLSSDAMAELVKRVAATDSITRGRDGLGRLLSNTPCPLLVDGACSVYEERPLVCRGYASFNWVSCADHSRRRRIWKQMPLDHVRRSGHSAALEGVIEGLSDAGLASGALELIAALRIALETPDAEARWLAGEDVFRDAIEVEDVGANQMKKSVSGRIFDTGAAEMLADKSVGEPGDETYRFEQLFCGPDGHYFLACAGGSGTYYAQLFEGKHVAGDDIIPLEPDEAHRWLEDHGCTQLIERMFPTHAPSSVMVELPKPIRQAAETCARREGLRVADWIANLVKSSTGRKSNDE
jgi:hypothetical protein